MGLKINFMEIDEDIIERKGARKAADIPPKVLELLNKGIIETVNLTEWLAADQLKVLNTLLKKLKKEKWYLEFEESVNSQKKISANNNTRVIGQLFSKYINDSKVVTALSNHTSDVVRCWACWAVTTGNYSTKQLADLIKPFAADTHFGVREVAIFATKEKFAIDLNKAVTFLSKWTNSKDENVRRFVAEVLRPIGVWTKKIEALQKKPKIGLPLIEPLKSDPSKYVQNSVANWLNDASKSQADWVRSICQNWEASSNSKSTQYIIKRGLRTINS